jgi:hypothetical protein
MKSSVPDFEFLTLQTVVDLPSSLEREIGRAIVRYARLEFILAQMLFYALNLTPVKGRAAIKDESATVRFDLIKSLRVCPVTSCRITKSSEHEAD